MTRIERQGSRIRVVSLSEGVPRTDDFDYVVVALPHSHLDTVHYSGERLGEAMRRHHARYDFPAHYLRITILFDRPFWRDRCADSYWMIDAFGGCCLYDESSRDPSCRYGVLGWLLAGDAARSASAWSDHRLVDAALGTLERFGTATPGRMLEGRVHRWIGSVNALPGGRIPRPHDHRHRPEPVEHPNLFVVGDYLFDSTLNGVVDSAQYVAAWIAGEIAERPHSTRPIADAVFAEG